MGKKSKEAKRRERKQRAGKKHLSLKPHEYYEVSGDSASRKRKSCPRCGPGTFLGEHNGRLYCGKCGYTEFQRKPGEPVQTAPEGPSPEKSQEALPETHGEARPEPKPEKPPQEQN